MSKITYVTAVDALAKMVIELARDSDPEDGDMLEEGLAQVSGDIEFRIEELKR